ncbi:MAG: hypothetical protein HYT82_00115 [Candidatus Harrisonbacteria bacterium]|nr:hypothetical protein [Candidatus Harrisonbacteria bacterium]
MKNHPWASCRGAAESNGNPFTLIPKLYRAKKWDELLGVLTGVYCYLRRRCPSRALRAAWKRELGDGSRRFRLFDFMMQMTGRRHRCGYFLRLSVDSRGVSECYLDYSNENLTISVDGHKSPIVRRMQQLLGTPP